MKYNHRVKVNGRWYGAGEEVKSEKPQETKAEKTQEPASVPKPQKKIVNKKTTKK